MHKRLLTTTFVSGVVALAALVGGRLVLAQEHTTASIAAVSGERGGQDITGPYDVVADWPKDISTLPGHEDWTWGAGQSVFAESSDRIYVLQRGELPNIDRPERKPIFDVGPRASIMQFQVSPSFWY